MSLGRAPAPGSLHLPLARRWQDEGLPPPTRKPLLRRIAESAPQARRSRWSGASLVMLASLALAAMDWIWETDAEFRLTSLSDRFAASTGPPAREALSWPVADVLAADEGAGLAERLTGRRLFRDLPCTLA